MAYQPEEDKIIWEGQKYDFKPKATIHAAIKIYKEGQPKLTIVESGEGFGKKPYSGMLLKRVSIEDIDTIIEILQNGKVQLEQFTLEWRKSHE